jgi:hypothetical protein
MTTCSLPELEQSSLRDLLRKKSPTFILGESNSCFFDVIERFEDCPEGLADFHQSDWLNLCECYNYQLLERWETKRDDIVEMFEEYKQAFGYSSTLDALENYLVEDPEDMAIQMVNCAMTYAAQTLYDVLEEEL